MDEESRDGNETFALGLVNEIVETDQVESRRDWFGLKGKILLRLLL